MSILLLPMPTPPAIATFTEEELARAPALMDELIGSLVAKLTNFPPDTKYEERMRAGELALALASRRPRLVAEFSASLGSRARSELTQNPRAPAPSRSYPATLTLVDEAAVMADVETARTAQAIKLIAEYELRELGAFLTTLAGESRVTRSYLVLHPDNQARALWDVAKLLPTQGGLHVHFMRLATDPLANALRKQWAAACTRLEDAGLVTAAYSTVILHAGARVEASAPRPSPVPATTLNGIAQALSALEHRLGADPKPAARSALRPDVARRDTAAARPSTDSEEEAELAQACILFVARIFDAFQTDRRIDTDLRPALERLRDPALRLEAADLSLARTSDHLLWALVDRIVWQARVLPAPPHRERVRTVQVLDGLVEQLVKGPAVDADRVRWALDRILVLEKNRHDRRTAQQAPQIAALAAVDLDLATAGAGAGGRPNAHGLDIGQLPTVPATLYDTLPAPLATPSPADAWLDALAPGDIATLLMRGRRVLAQLLWRSASGEVWLWADCNSDEVWPVRRNALIMLFQSGMAGLATSESIVREIANDPRHCADGIEQR